MYTTDPVSKAFAASLPSSASCSLIISSRIPIQTRLPEGVLVRRFLERLTQVIDKWKNLQSAWVLVDAIEDKNEHGENSLFIGGSQKSAAAGVRQGKTRGAEPNVRTS